MHILYYLNKINSDAGLAYTLIRTIVVYIYAIVVLRLGNKRFRYGTPFDFVLIIIVGAVLGRTIYAGTTLVATLGASTLLILLHWVFAVISYHSHRFGALVKGRSQILMRNGSIDWDMMKKNQITKEDLLESCREQLHTSDLTQVKEAHLERSGRISFLR